MPSTRPHFAWLLALALAACRTAAPQPEPHAAAAPAPASAPAAEIGPVVPFKFLPSAEKPWGLRVQRHRTLPAPPGSDGQALHFDTEENSRLWAVRTPAGSWVINETLTSHSETKNGDPDEDPVLVALTGVNVGMEISAEGKFVGAVDPQKTVHAIAKRWPGGGSEFEHLPPEVFTKELERDWRLGAQIYFEHPVHVNEPVYSLLSVSLPQLPGKYVIVAERFAAPTARPDGTLQVASTQQLFGRSDPRWAEARQTLAPIMKALDIGEDDLLDDFKGTGGETVGVTSLEVFSSSYEGEGVFPLTTPRGSFPLRFEIEEVAGEIAPPPLPRDNSHTAARALPASGGLAAR